MIHIICRHKWFVYVSTVVLDGVDSIQHTYLVVVLGTTVVDNCSIVANLLPFTNLNLILLTSYVNSLNLLH